MVCDDELCREITTWQGVEINVRRWKRSIPDYQCHSHGQNHQLSTPYIPGASSKGTTKLYPVSGNRAGISGGDICRRDTITISYKSTNAADGAMYKQHVEFTGNHKTYTGNSAMNDTVPPPLPKTAIELWNETMKRKQKPETITGLNVPILDGCDEK